MSLLPILIWPDACLTQRCASVGAEPMDELIADMFDTMSVSYTHLTLPTIYSV